MLLLNYVIFHCNYLFTCVSPLSHLPQILQGEELVLIHCISLIQLWLAHYRHFLYLLKEKICLHRHMWFQSPLLFTFHWQNNSHHQKQYIFLLQSLLPNVPIQRSILNWYIAINFFFFFRILLSEKGEGKERERERNIHVKEKHQLAASRTPPTRDLALNPGMCPDWEWNQWRFGPQAST